jgi:hypothetical protein
LEEVEMDMVGGEGKVDVGTVDVVDNVVVVNIAIAVVDGLMR